MKLENDLKKNLLVFFSKIKKKKLPLHEPFFLAMKRNI